MSRGPVNPVARAEGLYPLIERGLRISIIGMIILAGLNGVGFSLTTCPPRAAALRERIVTNMDGAWFWMLLPNRFLLRGRPVFLLSLFFLDRLARPAMGALSGRHRARRSGMGSACRRAGDRKKFCLAITL